MNILTILSEVRTYLIRRKAPPFRWQPLGEIWTLDPHNDQKFDDIVESLSEEPAVIVIDPLSLYVDAVFNLCLRLQTCLENESASIMILQPLNDVQHFNVRSAAYRLTEEYCRKIYGINAKALKATCDVLTPDDFEVRRLVASAIRQSNTKHWALAQDGGRR